jgi:peptide/nickel transport system substrate-binding protein
MHLKRPLATILGALLLLGGAALGTGERAARAAAGNNSTLTIANSTDVPGLDPDIRQPTTTARVTMLIFQPLFQLNNKGQLVDVLATGYKNLGPDAWEFFLRKGVRFQDGTPWDAQAFVDNLKRMFDPHLPNGGESSEIPLVLPDATTIVNPYTVIVHTKSPDAVLPRRFAQYYIVFASPKVIDGHSPAYVNQHPVGTGPYKFVTWKPDNYLELKAWSGYWGPKPTIQTVIFKPIPDAQSRVSALLSGQVQIATDVPIESIPLIEHNPGTKMAIAPSGTLVWMLFLNAQHGGPLANPTVRLALNYAVDRNSIIKHILGGEAIPIQSGVAPQDFGFDAALPPYGYHPRKARALLKKAGYPHGFSVDLWYNPGFTPNESEVVQAIQADLATIGVKANLKPMPFPPFLTKVETDKVDGMFYTPKVNQIMDCDGFFADEAPGTIFGQYDPIVGKARSLWLEERATFNPSLRASLCRQIQQILYNQPNWVYLFQINQLYGVSSRVQGFVPNIDGTITLQGVTLKS